VAETCRQPNETDTNIVVTNLEGIIECKSYERHDPVAKPSTY